MNTRQKSCGYIAMGAMVALSACAPNTDPAPVSPAVKEAADDGGTAQRMANINGVKMRLSGPTLKTGDKVYDPQVRQEALVKDTIVVVGKPGFELDTESLPFAGTVKSLVGRTYEIRVLDQQANMYALYQQLKQDPRFSQVELQLQYLSGREPAEY
ncbi:hypothetical protein [Bowmanella dokdonensis]|uniref:Lipoprotein n=1 Tax=Bowmanella dokdonensis TaxID=751969 RepID=A0A939IQF2_9ALTE|nr:hypothetical protein [Bowmanella dokdonensis]MBN7824401.1 hypothetical protein [Bowmanella dokdonensis]